ncbi:hypothetical protein [cf. Phormidesmis sp. LEGE 11477]|uniref:hypothetical protein n=1 Tax=cf. Phormidesmis sp. LEGE 11477 TaxID=1828680 RepID=UPI001880BBBD|nr:hypothetical protein [cf. Phormidesmis sp. LEGE 11477]MBE9061887.1 hypothetical protein [cf. Phormidesmis sp. LEGE 11477]
MISSQTGIDVGVDALKSLPGTVVLPPVRSEHFVSQKHEVNPALAFNLLKDIQSVVSVWHEQLRQIVNALHALHAQGPMVDGWLESSVQPSRPVAQAAGADSTILRHGDADALLRYVEALDSASSNDMNRSSSIGQSGDATKVKEATATYRLCHMNGSGQVISQPCPSEQMGTVSMAIARYHKFRQLMNKKQAIEAKLQRAVDGLTGTRTALRE